MIWNDTVFGHITLIREDTTVQEGTKATDPCGNGENTPYASESRGPVPVSSSSAFLSALIIMNGRLVHFLLLLMVQFHVMIPEYSLPEDSYLEQQIIDVLNQFIAQKSGYQLNDKALAQIHVNAKTYDRLVNDQHYLMKTELTDDGTCVVQFTTDQGAVMTTYTFFKAIISEETKK